MRQLPKLQLNKKVAIATSILALFLVVAVAGAQEVQRTFTLINPTLEHSLNPGEKASGTTKIINESNTPLTFSVGIQDFIVDDTVGTPQLLPPNTLSNKYSASAWIGVTPSQFTVEPGHSQVINYYIQTPPDAKPGGHYAAIVYEPASGSSENATGGQVKTQLGSLFYITIKGPVKEAAKVTKFTANGLQEYGPVNIYTQIKNDGDLHISPKGTISVSGFLFNQTQDLDTHNIFPETARDFQNKFGNILMLGRYKAQLTASYGIDGNLPLVATLYFWVIPWRLIIVVILVIVAVILGSKYLKRRRNKSGGSTKAQEEPVKEDEGGNTTEK